jgi:hypothetical protein
MLPLRFNVWRMAVTVAQKSLAGLVLGIAAALGIYEATVWSRQSAASARVELEIARLTDELRASRVQQNAAESKLQSIEHSIDLRLAQSRAAPSQDAALSAQMATWLSNIDRLKAAFEQQPNLRIPELQLLNEKSWTDVASRAKFDTEADTRRALALVRNAATNQMATKLQKALNAYLKANDGTLPDSLAQLTPFLQSPIDASWLDRYELGQTGKLSDVPARSRNDLITIKTPVDVEFDSYWRIGTSGFVVGSFLSEDIAAARRAFSTANGGQKAISATQLAPFLKWPVDESTVQKYLNPLPAGPR